VESYINTVADLLAMREYPVQGVEDLMRRLRTLALVSSQTINIFKKRKLTQSPSISFKFTDMI
jgi:hypothetical protein